MAELFNEDSYTEKQKRIDSHEKELRTIVKGLSQEKDILKRFSEDQQKVLEMRYLKNKMDEEVAMEMGIDMVKVWHLEETAVDELDYLAFHSEVEDIFKEPNAVEKLKEGYSVIMTNLERMSQEDPLNANLLKEYSGIINGLAHKGDLQKIREEKGPEFITKLRVAKRAFYAKMSLKKKP